jgi:hypothetical protein
MRAEKKKKKNLTLASRKCGLSAELAPFERFIVWFGGGMAGTGDVAVAGATLDAALEKSSLGPGAFLEAQRGLDAERTRLRAKLAIS